MLSGYRLHLKRLDYSQEKSIRSIKIPLGYYGAKSPFFERSHLEDGLALKIKDDYENLYGALNITTYQKNRDIYSLKDFWLDCLRSGAIMKHTEAKLLSDLRYLSGEQKNIDDEQKKLMQKTNLSFFNLIDFEKFKSEIIISTEVRTTKKSCGFFKDSVSKEIQDKYSNEILTATKGKPRPKQNKYFFEKFGVKKDLYSLKECDGTTFYLLPDLQFQSGDEELSPIDLIDRIENYLKDKLGQNYTSVKEYIGVSNNAGGLDQLFNKIFNLLSSNQIDKIENLFHNMSSIWKGKEDELRKRLGFLCTQAQKIPQHPGLVKNYNSYRTDFGGKIESWISNSLGQDEKIKNCLFGNQDTKAFNGKTNKSSKNSHYKDLELLIDNLQQLKSDSQFVIKDIGYLPFNGNLDEINNVDSIARQMINILKTFPRHESQSKIEANQILAYRQLLTVLKEKLNKGYQHDTALDEEQSKGKKSKKKTKSANSIYKGLFSNLPKIPSFFGDVKTQKGGLYDKYFSSLDRVQSGIKLIINLHMQESNTPRDITEEEKDFEERFLRFLHNIFMLTKRISGSSVIAKQILIKILYATIDGNVEDILKDKNSLDYIFRSPYARERRGAQFKFKFQTIEKPHNDLPQIVDYVFHILSISKINWQKYNDISYLNEWVHLIEIEKMRAGLISWVYDIKSFKDYFLNDEELKSHFPLIDITFKGFKEEDWNNNIVINTVLNRAIFSELKGTISKMTTKKIIARYVLQPIDSEKEFPIVLNNSLSNKSMRSKDQSYYLSLYNETKDGQFFNISKGKKLSKEVFSKSSSHDSNGLLKLNTSKYQLQFLDNSLFNKWHSHKPAMSSYSFIYEEVCHLDWGPNGVSLTVNENQRRLFVSIPFNLSGRQNDKIKNTINSLVTKFLGVDIGEYGIATYLLDIKQSSNKPLHTSFFSDAALRKIKDGVRSNKQSQQLGTFSIPSSDLKRLRDNATTNIRNHVHRLVVSLTAKPVYEREVSGFESGSGAVSKIYHSIKQSDVFDSSEANALERKLVWGSKFLTVGKNISAYATSYCCSYCKNSIYALIDTSEREKLYLVQKINPTDLSEIKIKVGNHWVYGYLRSKKDEEELEKSKQDGEYYLMGKTVINAFRNYARPPLDVLLKRKSKIFNNKNEIDFLKSRGNQAIFLCPFVDCHEVSDADIQAAMWIALKGYLDEYSYKKERNKNQIIDEEIKARWIDDVQTSRQKIEALLHYAKKLKIEPISLKF